MRKPTCWTWWAAIVVVGVGCATLKDSQGQKLEEPTLTFSSVDLSDPTLGGATLNLHYIIHNPNPVGLKLDEVKYSLFVDDHPVVAGPAPKGLDVSASKGVPLVLSSTVRFADLGSTLEGFLARDSARYRVEGELGIKAAVGMVSLPVTRQGTFAIPKIPQAHFGSPRLSARTFNGATAELAIVFDNRNPFPLPLGGLTGTVFIAGARVAEVRTEPVGVLPASGQRAITVPVHVDYAKSYAAGRALEVGEATVRFSGTFESGGGTLPLELQQKLRF